MNPYYDHAGITIYHGKSEAILRELPDSSVDAIVTDPPSGIGFMGLDWDRHKGGRDKWVAWLCGLLADCRRVLKPGHYGWVWALPRTSHWTATACEDAGFEVRDIVTHVFGQGMPKSKALLKPAVEHWILIKSPGKLRDLRIEACRISCSSPKATGGIKRKQNKTYGNRPASAFIGPKDGHDPSTGRWPANFALSHSEDCAETCAEGCPVADLDRQSGQLEASGSAMNGTPSIRRSTTPLGLYSPKGDDVPRMFPGDIGGASKFFYVAKPSKSEKSRLVAEGNNHPTVKPVRLMRYLIELVTEPGAVILDPFLGSGTTAVAAQEMSRKLIGIEQDDNFCGIATKRLAQGSLF